MNYKEQAKADRKAAAKQRQQDDYRQDAGYRQIYDEKWVEIPIGKGDTFPL